MRKLARSTFDKLAEARTRCAEAVRAAIPRDSGQDG
jgi:hypothetical protein